MRVDSLNIETSAGATTAYVDRPVDDTNTAVVLIHASRYADEGYNCIAPDLFRGRVAQDVEEASTLMQALAIEDGLETIRKAMDASRDTYGFDQFAINGYCMGGTFALRAACEIPELKAAAPFYGDIPEENVLKKLSVPTLFIAGNRDNWINPEKVDGLRAAASKHGLPVEVVSYDADHAFFNDTRPEVYNEGAAADAWQRVLRHFERYTAADQEQAERPATFP